MTRLVLLFQFFLLNIFLSTYVLAKYTRIVQTDKGKVRGNILETIHLKRRYSAFKGIPYAEPPIGYGRRFRRPVPAKPWSRVLNATEDPNDCAQWQFTLNPNDRHIGSEDCLYLNVYTPELNFTNPRPRAVMAYIHGGAFQFESIHSSKLGPDFLIEKDVVVVVMNYRLGVFGFLAIAPAYFDANNGLRDQAEALRWIQRNIRKFGGDPDKVTLFGESAGAASVEYHKLSPQSKDLFRASIAMSGAALNEWAYFPSRQSAYMGWHFVGSLLNYWSDEEDLYRQMVHKNQIPFRPTNEDKSVKDPFLPYHPLKLYRSGQFTAKPHMLGVMKDEGISFVALISIVTDILGNSFTKRLSSSLTDVFFIKDIDLTQRFLSTHSKAPVYYYMNSFDYDQALHKVDAMKSKPGAGHGDDIAHIFWVNNKRQPIDPNSDIGRHRQRMVTMWTNFAKYLKPILNDDHNLGNVSWEESGTNGGYLDINRNLIFHANSRPISENTAKMEYDRAIHGEY
ncbi:venom carboxylesterase-6-like [Chelonus insularis]|uniref:venom carboxylesterase-6-like n=1 Tax=Chelonus insularis TaxID=460826 RepID=UPI00158D645C|nr:venom carboxylesterase-6-like [Chelonus insularis]